MEKVKVKQIDRYRDGGTVVYEDELNRRYYVWAPTGKVYNQMPGCSIGGDTPKPYVKEINVELEIVDENSISEALFYIQNEGYCGNALFWWGKNSKGYVTDIRQAGKYTYAEAKNICQRDEDHAYPVMYIDGLLTAQKLIIDSQYVSKSNEMLFEND